MIKTFYVKAASKKAINEMLANGKVPTAVSFNLGGSEYINLKRVPVGSVIKIYEKSVSGNPYAKSYGTWTGEKVK